MPFVEDVLDFLADVNTNAQNLRLLFQYRQRLVPFVGAGLSTDFGYPSWNKLLSELSKQAGPQISHKVERHLGAHRFEEAAEAVCSLPNLFDDTIRDMFDHQKLDRPIELGAVRYLPSIAGGMVLTTNFDRVIESAFEDAGCPFSDVFPGSRIREAFRAIQLDERFLLKLHGDYRDSESRILTLAQYTQEYGSPNPEEADLRKPVPRILSRALTARPLFFLGCSLRSDRTIGVIARIARVSPGTIHFALLSEADNNAKRRQELDSWNIRPIFYPRDKYDRIERLLEHLARYCILEGRPLGIPAVASVKGQKRHSAVPRQVRINGYKLFYFRSKKTITIGRLAALLQATSQQVARLEKVRQKPGSFGLQCFQCCERNLLLKIERTLDCRGKLAAGVRDDFLSQYVHFYVVNKGKKSAPHEKNQEQFQMQFPTKAIVFDFDGTLTEDNDDETTWEKIWVSLGYPVNDCSDLHTRFMRKEFSHDEWCKITRDKFRERGFTEKHLRRIAKDTILIKGAGDTIRRLRNMGIRLYIVSGSIKQVIRQCFGDLYDAFEEIKANEIIFDPTGLISDIIGTRYDFWGKAIFLKKLIEENKFSPWEVLYIGNSGNDDWACLAGVRTLCVNPRFTRPHDSRIWTHTLRKMGNLGEIMKFVHLDTAHLDRTG